MILVNEYLKLLSNIDSFFARLEEEYPNKKQLINSFKLDMELLLDEAYYTLNHSSQQFNNQSIKNINSKDNNNENENKHNENGNQHRSLFSNPRLLFEE